MAHLQLAYVLFEQGDMEGVLAEVEAAGRLGPDSWEIPAWRARVHQFRDEPDAVRAECDLVASKTLREPSLQRARGPFLESFCDRPDLALADISNAIESAPEWADVYCDRGRTFLRLDRLQEALADFDMGVSMAPAWGGPRLERGWLSYEMDRYEEALADYTKATELAPGSVLAAQAYVNRGWVLMVLGRREEAMADLDRAVSLNAYYLVDRERAHLAFGHIEEALADAERDVSAHASEPTPYVRRALVRTFEQGACGLVAADLRRMPELSPASSSRVWLDSLEAEIHHAHLIHACPDLYDPQVSLDSVRRTARTETGDVFSLARSTLAISLYRAGKYEEALSNMRHAHGWLPGDKGMRLFILAMCAQRVGKKQEARVYYDRGVAWMKNLPDDLYTLRFRQEAEKVMGLQRHGRR